MSIRLPSMFAVLALGALGACASAPDPDAAKLPADYDIDVRPDFRYGQFEVTFRSRSDQPLCMEMGDWPADGGVGKEALPLGSLHAASNWVYAERNGQTHPIEDENFGVCIPPRAGGARVSYCSKLFAPYQTAHAVIPFSRFPSLPTLAPGDSLTLHYKPRVTVCKSTS